MKNPREWSGLTYLISGMVVGMILAYGLLLAFEPALWLRVLMIIAIPSGVGIVAALLRENIFWFLSS